jgi:hypothetical protein
MFKRIFIVLLALGLMGQTLSAQTGEFFPFGSSWRYFLGTREASSPTDAWRALAFNDSGWSTGVAPIGFGEAGLGTVVPTSANSRWTSVFFRKTFVVDNPASVAQIDLSVIIDDGYAAWINGQPVGRYNVPEGALTYDTPTRAGLPLGAIETTQRTHTVSNEVASLLRPGTNVIAVMGFNANRTSSDFIFDATLRFAIDQTAPQVAQVIPPQGATMPALTQIEVWFDEAVQGVDAADLRVNGQAATRLTVIADHQYVFEFAPPQPGIVHVTWQSGHGIRDLAGLPNAFEGAPWTYTVDPEAAPPGLIVSEFMADNRRTLRDEDGDDSDWIEIYNAGFTPVDLKGWSLTIRSNAPGQWAFPAVTLLANRYLVVFASGKDRTNPATPLHTNFKLDKEGGYLALVNPAGAFVSDFAPGYPMQQTDISYGRARLDPTQAGYFPVPTPGAPNTVGGPGFAPEVLFSVSSRPFTAAFSLVLTTDSTNAVIRYSLSTNIPTEASTRYTGPINVAGSLQVRARAFEPGLLPGSIRSETYLQLAPELTDFRSDLPILVLHNFGRGQVPASVDQFVAVQAFEPKFGASALGRVPDLAAQGIFHKRGRSTGGLPKASFFLEIQDELGEDWNVSLAGLPKESDWVLYAPNDFDPVLIHNPMAHELMRQIGRYSPRTRFVEVFLKDDTGAPGPVTAADYNGLYVLTEKIKIGGSRVDIDKLRPEHTTTPSVTGGYLLSIDSAPPGTTPFFAAGTAINYLDPDYFDITTPQRDAQKRYIADYFNAFYQALTGPNAADPASGYAAYLDVEAAIDHHLQGVITFNVDALRLSGYFHKPRDGRITMGPVWDFDRTQGSADGRDFNPRLWRSTVPDYGTDMFNSDPRIFGNPWYSRMFQDLEFWQRWIDRYQQLRTSVLRNSQVHAMIDALAEEVRQAQPREVARWKGSRGSDTSPRSGTRSSGGYSYTFPGTYQGEVDFMKHWYSNRLDFLDGQFVALPRLNREAGQVLPGSTVALTGPAGATVYYTLDGSDPRRVGGTVSPQARAYSGPISIGTNTRLVARSQNLAHRNLTGANNPPLSSTWSGPVTATLIVQTPPLVLTEIMYNPPPTEAGLYDAQEFEYLEFRNAGTEPLSLAGLQLTRGVQFVFPAVTLPAGERVLVVRSVAAFQSRYGAIGGVIGAYTGQLDNAGERLVLEGPLGEPVLDFAYSPQWYPITDGQGFSLVLVNEPVAPGPNSGALAWRPSAARYGSPGTADPSPPNFPTVLVNEILAYPVTPDLDAIELHNAGATPADLGGWLLTDDRNQPAKFRLPAGTVLPPGGFKVFTEADFNPGGPGSFALSALGETVSLYSADSTTNLTGYLHRLSFGVSERGVSFGRYVNRAGEEQSVAQQTPSLGSVNVGPRVGPVVISEIMYHPPPAAGLASNDRDEFLELHGINSAATPLFASDAPTNTWRLRGGVDFDFPPNITLPADGILLLVGFDPALDPLALAAFRNRYQLSADVPIFGPWSGRLDNSGENIRLLKPHPSPPIGADTAATSSFVLVEEIAYSSAAPWPTDARATGNSIQRMAPSSYGNDPFNWRAAPASPGQRNSSDELDSDGDGLPDAWETAHGLDPHDARGDQGADGDPDGDQMTNLQEYRSGTHPRDASSYLHVESIRADQGRVILRFQAAAGITYSILHRQDVDAGTWQKLMDVPASPTSGQREATDAVAEGPSRRVYRLVTPATP